MNFPRHTNTQRGLFGGCILLAAALSGCASEPTALEQSLGDSVRQAWMQQSVQTPDSVTHRQPFTTDGVIAVQGIDRYHQSYVKPAAPVSVLNIQTGGAAAAPAMPR